MPRKEYTKAAIDLKPDVAVGIKVPIVGQTGRVFQQSYTTEEQAISNLKSLILTRKGERYMQPRLGTKIYDYLFENLYPGIEDDVRGSLLADINYWLPYIIINRISVDIKDDRGNYVHLMKVGIDFQVTEAGANTQITFTLGSGGIEIG